MQHEIAAPGPLLDDAGRLREGGWARRPLLDANLERAARGPWGRLRLKRWDYYGIWTPEIYASATVAHLGYVGNVFTYAVDRRSGRCAEHSILRPLGAGIALPRSSEAGDVRYDDGRIRVEFLLEPGRRRLRVADGRFDAGSGLELEVALEHSPEHESVVTATPFPGGGFYYNRKINAMPARGALRWGDRRVEVAPGSALGQLDWGRGVWPFRSHWLWASANGFAGDGRTLGLNLGHFGDTSRATENALILDGRVQKLGRVEIAFDSRDHRKPWRFSDDAGRLDVVLVPSAERIARTRALGLGSEVHQLFGSFSGRVVPDGGGSLRIDDLPGFAEEHRARW